MLRDIFVIDTKCIYIYYAISSLRLSFCYVICEKGLQTLENYRFSYSMRESGISQYANYHMTSRQPDLIGKNFKKS